MKSKKAVSSNSRIKSKEVNQLSRIENTIKRIEIKINDKLTPFSIGDKIIFYQQDRLIKTITSIRIEADGRVAYMLEWFDPLDSSFKSEWLTMTELILFKETERELNKVGFAQS